jgi:hypothetical protein
MLVLALWVVLAPVLMLLVALMLVNTWWQAASWGSMGGRR